MTGPFSDAFPHVILALWKVTSVRLPTHLPTHQLFPQYSHLGCQPLREAGTFAITPHDNANSKHREVR